ncbi:MAG: DUF86 domain-containing protein [Candidatus Eisenbacteria bacterium]
MQRDDRVYLRHMLDMSRKARALASGKTIDEFAQDEVLRLALRHLIQIVGEAANQVSQDFRATNPEIPWDEIVGMRHRVVHDYMGIDEEIVWRTVVDDLPNLIRILEVKVGD